MPGLTRQSILFAKILAKNDVGQKGPKGHAAKLTALRPRTGRPSDAPPITLWLTRSAERASCFAQAVRRRHRRSSAPPRPFITAGAPGLLKRCTRVGYNLTRPTCKGLVIHGCRLRRIAPQRARRLFLVLLFIGAFLQHTCFPQGQASPLASQAAYEIPKHRFRSRRGKADLIRFLV